MASVLILVQACLCCARGQTLCVPLEIAEAAACGHEHEHGIVQTRGPTAEHEHCDAGRHLHIELDVPGQDETMPRQARIGAPAVEGADDANFAFFPVAVVGLSWSITPPALVRAWSPPLDRARLEQVRALKSVRLLI
ncbi:MAG: hypothetical protein SGJ11_05080 [Phycisphaerae bacterium]|nr:hypothetical protein [Phycisphaerae bacterium]